MKKIGAFFAFVMIYGCSTITYVEHDIDKSINFRRLTTYAWLPSHDQQYVDQRYNNQIIENNIKLYAADALQSKGLRLSVDSPEVLFFYDLQIEKGSYTIQSPIYSHPHNFIPPPPSMMFSPGLSADQQLIRQQQMQQQWSMQQWIPPQIIGYETKQIPFKAGTLTIIAIDRKTNRMVWRGWAESCVTNPSDYRDNLERKIKTIFRSYPGINN
jgi:hypothetical protein